jgi:hypothetical protein
LKQNKPITNSYQFNKKSKKLREKKDFAIEVIP